MRVALDMAALRVVRVCRAPSLCGRNRYCKWLQLGTRILNPSDASTLDLPQPLSSANTTQRPTRTTWRVAAPGCLLAPTQGQRWRRCLAAACTRLVCLQWAVWHSLCVSGQRGVAELPSHSCIGLDAALFAVTHAQSPGCLSDVSLPVCDMRCVNDRCSLQCKCLGRPQRSRCKGVGRPMVHDIHNSRMQRVGGESGMWG
jgi:hypothetical protein